MTFDKIIKKFKYNGENFLQNLGRYAGTTVDLRVIRSELVLLGYEGRDLDIAIEELKVCCRSKPEMKEPEDMTEQIAEVITAINPFQNLRIIQSSKFLVVWEKDGMIEILGPIESLKADELDNLFSKYEPEMMARLTQSLSSLINPKASYRVSGADILDICLNILNPKITLPRVMANDEDIHPTVVEGCEVPALRKIKYSKQDTSFTELNPLLQEFFGRVDNHKHMCAIIWGQLTGRQWPYICYLYGKQGREGKTSFIGMLGDLTKSYATLTDDSRFSLQPLYGKSIIMVPENDRSRFVNMKSIKAITGGNLLSIEEKGKNPFSGRIRGTIFVDANVPLKINGKAYETERLYFLTVKPNITAKEDRLSPATYIAELGSTPNEFLNYCRQACEELITPGGMLRDPDNHSTIMENLADYEQDYSYENLLTKLCKSMKLQLQSGLITHKAEFLSRARSASENKKDFYSDSFIHFLEKKGIKDLGKELQGIGYVSDGHTSFVLPNS